MNNFAANSMKSKKHIKATPIKSVPITNLSIVNTDHLVDVCKNSITDSKTTAQLKMHRSKCSEMIETVMSCNHYDTGDIEFSLLLDESNDITANNTLGIIIMYYSEAHE